MKIVIRSPTDQVIEWDNVRIKAVKQICNALYEIGKTNNFETIQYINGDTITIKISQKCNAKGE